MSVIYWRMKLRKNSNFSSYRSSTCWASFFITFAKICGAFFAKCSVATWQKKISSGPWFETSTAFWSRKGIFVHDWFFFFTNKIRIRIRNLDLLDLGHFSVPCPLGHSFSSLSFSFFFWTFCWMLLILQGFELHPLC